MGKHRTEHSGLTILKGSTAFLSNGQKIDLQSISIENRVIDGNSEDSGQGGMPRDNIDNGTNIMPQIIHMIKIMKENSIERIILDLNQSEKNNKGT